MIDTAEGRTSVWEYVNPVAITKFAYFNPLGSAVYGPWRALAAGRGLTLPGVLPVGRPVRVGALGKLFTTATSGPGGQGGAFVSRVAGAGRVLGRVATRGIGNIGLGGKTGATEAMELANNGLISWRKWYMNKALQQTPMIEGVGIPGKARAVNAVMEAITTTRPGAVAMARAGLIWAGRVVNPIMNVLLAAQVAKFVGETAFKTVRATVDVVNRAAERAYNLDLGGELTRGFLTSTAATERQRALQAIQASHLSGRRFLGGEAELAHNL